MGYNHQDIEKKAREKWEKGDIYQTNLSDDLKEPYYLLAEFPYPSGDLHIGHWYAFAVTDIYARLLRLRGKNVLFPIGFDAFGLPAENAAIKHGVNPAEWTYKNIERMRTQLISMGASFDWSKEVLTCDPTYYQWTQWLFTKLFEQNLADRREATVKWCPKDQTVLANEQVHDGHCERCGTVIEEKRLTQWFFKITEYAERLLSGLETLPWREEIKEAQRSWIGKSEGASIDFPLSDRNERVRIFTTRPDTIFGATYLVLAPEHPLVTDLLNAISNTQTVVQYITATTQKTERERSENKEKTGVLLEGISVINPATQEKIPVYVADYVLASYGTGAVMAVPAHDERDFAFAEKMNLPVTPVIESTNYPFTGDGILINSGTFTGHRSDEARDAIGAYVGSEKTTQYRLRDWLVSRQRYWGCPIPIVYDPEGKPHAIPSEHLPWLLPTDVDFAPTGQAPLASSPELKERVTRLFGEGWTPEYDTLDTFVDSSWYFLRYLDSKDTHNFSDTALMKKWLPINRYSGGSEHTTMHLLYARFFMKALYDLALVPVDEPFTERFNRGLIMGTDGMKMSKSKGNVVNPDEFVARYGADAVRVYLAFIGPYNEPGNYPWNLDGVASMRKFLERVARLIERIDDSTEVSGKMERALAQASAKVSTDGDRFKFNTGIATLMILVNEFETTSSLPKNAFAQLLIMLAPFAPHLTEHLWEEMGGVGSVHLQSWPEYALTPPSEVAVVVQIQGKRRGSIMLSPDASEEEALEAIRTLPAIRTLLEEAKSRRVVYIPGKIINVVL
ncbi:MAG TPA: leucine--tRNA ligase [Candidatus Paceibacterota bacterium]|nr:leucine--tRNA ligase [Candidatus Paceibacterota bacterium]